MQGLTEAHGILMSERRVPTRMGIPWELFSWEGVKAANPPNAWIVKDCQAAVISKGESYSKGAAEVRAASNPVVQFNVGTVRNPIFQEDAQPQASSKGRGRDMILHVGQGEPLRTEYTLTCMQVLSITGRGICSWHLGQKQAGLGQGDQKADSHQLKDSCLGMRCAVLQTHLWIQKCALEETQRGCNLSPIRIQNNCFLWTPPVTAKGKSWDLWASSWPMELQPTSPSSLPLRRLRLTSDSVNILPHVMYPQQT